MSVIIEKFTPLKPTMQEIEDVWFKYINATEEFKSVFDWVNERELEVLNYIQKYGLRL